MISLPNFIIKPKMLYQVTEIEFDFDDAIDEPLTEEVKQEITSQYIDVWEAEDEDDLVEEITASSGWCVKSIDYVVLHESY